MADYNAQPNGGVIRRFLRNLLPKGLYTRSLLIVIVPMIVLQSVVALLFLERHLQLVTEKLSAAVSQDIAALVAIYDITTPEQHNELYRIANARLSLSITLLPYEELPAVGPKPWFGLLERTLAREVSRRVDRPFWINSVGETPFVEIRVRLKDKVMRVIVRKSQVFASNAHIFIIWMVGAAIILLTVAILFLRNQIKPIQQLARAADAFGKGRDMPWFRPRGAREIRQASQAFLDMKERIAKQIEQRTAMLAGVSHDLRTVLTRFRLEIALLGDTPELDGMKSDINEMEKMLAGYLDFARGAESEPAEPTDIGALLHSVAQDSARSGHAVEVQFSSTQDAIVRPNLLKRALGNLVVNAARFATIIRIQADYVGNELVVRIDDNGPGIAEDQREEVFRPFVRLDEARNQDHAGSGLGMTIALDAARAHGGTIELSRSPLGGLRAEMRLPV